MTNENVTNEERDGPTPNGGVRSVAYYLDDDGNPAAKASATRVKIVECDAEGNLIFRTYGTLGVRGQEDDD